MATHRVKAIQLEHMKPGQVLPDGGGLSVVCHPTGQIAFYARFREDGRLKRLSLGKFPATSLKQARDKLGAIKKQLEAGESPTRERKEKKRLAAVTFADIATDYVDLLKKNNEADGKPALTTIEKTEHELELASKGFGTTPLNKISTKMVSDVCLAIATDRRETARKTLGAISRAFRYAAARGVVQRDPAFGLRGMLPKPKVRHMPAVTGEDDLKKLLNDVWGYPHLIVRACMQLQFYLVARPHETRSMKWKDLDLKTKTWTLEAPGTKTRKARYIPLPTQVTDVLEQLAVLRDLERSEFVFPSMRGKSKYLSEGACIAMLRSLGWSSDQFVPHGSRAVFKTLAEDAGKDRLLIELQLGHITQDTAAETYDRSKGRLEQRRELVQWYADKLDELRFGKKVKRR